MTSSEYEELVAGIAKEFSNNPLDSKTWTIKHGRANRIEGFSSFKHQIDVSLECDSDIVLIECKMWTKNITVSEYLVLLGRVLDIKKRNPNKRVRGAMVTTKGWQPGVSTLNSTYNDHCSLFNVSRVGEVLERIHKAFIQGHTEGTSHVSGTLQNKT